MRSYKPEMQTQNKEGIHRINPALKNQAISGDLTRNKIVTPSRKVSSSLNKGTSKSSEANLKVANREDQVSHSEIPIPNLEERKTTTTAKIRTSEFVAVSRADLEEHQQQLQKKRADAQITESDMLQTVISDLSRLYAQLNIHIIGQEHLIRCLLMTLLTDGHLLVEGAPGLAKTTAIKMLSQCIHCDFHRIQFTPDLLPSDILGSEIYRPQREVFEFQGGGIFNQIILADEINRAPAKVQSALLEAMEERQVSVGQKTYSLPDIFMVMATQNPLDQEGTYPLPEAQLDRFLFKVNIDYPSSSTEKKILELHLEREKVGSEMVQPFEPIEQDIIMQARHSVRRVHISDSIKEYIVQLVISTRQAQMYDEDLANLISCGASPRATIALSNASRANALLSGRNFVKPEDVQQVLFDVLRHRILLSFEAQANRVSSDDIIRRLLDLVPIF